MAPILAPGVSERDFATAIDRFRKTVGDEFVLTDDAALEPYRDPYPIAGRERFAAAAAVCPETPEQVQEIVRIANETGVPLSPVSTGRNLGYGGGAPRLSGAVVVDTGRRMNRILEVNERLAYALVEPGVTYFDLYQHLQDNGIKLWIDCPDLGWGSVVGNTLDRGVGYTPYGDHFMWQTGMEVVLPDGDIVRTGMGAVPGSNTWQLFPYGFGPYPDGLFTQSNYGIVTKMGIGLMPEPPGYRPYLITFENESDLEQIVDIILPLRINMAPLQNAPVLRNIVLDAGVVSKRDEWHDGDDPLPDEAIERMKRELGLGYWNFYGALYGPPPIMDMYWGIIQEAFGQIPGARFHTLEDRAGEDDRGGHILRDRANIARGIPSLEELKLLEWIPNGAHIGFSPISAPDGADAMRQYTMVRDRCREYRKDYAAQIVVGLREMHHICLFLYDKEDPAQREETFELTRLLVREAAEAGYGEYRTHLGLMDEVMATFGWNDGALRRLHERIKDALDPNGIMAPGKSGIWGSRYRDQAADL